MSGSLTDSLLVLQNRISLYICFFFFCLEKSIPSGVPVFVLCDIIKIITFFICDFSWSCRLDGVFSRNMFTTSSSGCLTAPSRKQMPAKRLRRMYGVCE